MPVSTRKLRNFELPVEMEREIEERWRNALVYLRQRRSVVFLTSGRFWQAHGFVQQSLAYTLVEHGIRTVWLDGEGWRPYLPKVSSPRALLTVKQMFRLPGLRIPLAAKMDRLLLNRRIHGELSKLGGDPFVWIQSGIGEEIAEVLPKIDVYSVFDNPRAHSPTGILCTKAKLITFQNSFARKIMGEIPDERAQVLYPPVEVGPHCFEDTPPPELPLGFPTARVGYVGSLFDRYFDFATLERIILKLPEMGFILQGRVDPESYVPISRLQGYRNFHYLESRPRSQVAATWRLLDVCLLFYQDSRSKDGGFPTKILESLFFRVPSVATPCPATREVLRHVPQSSNTEALIQMISRQAQRTEEDLFRQYLYYAFEMHPKLHIARIVERVRNT